MSSARTVRILASVGRNGANRRDDVLAVQQLINSRLPVPLRPLDVDGRCGSLTIAAIEEIQRRFLRMSQPDGRVDPNGPTLRVLTGGSAPLATPQPRSGSFPPAVIEAAQASQKKWKIPASIVLAQWALESGWGRLMPPGSNNPFGIKAVKGQAHVMSRTQEYVNGQWISIIAPFRKFASMIEAFDQHGWLLATGRYYKHARSLLPDPDAFADALTGVYATAPNYGTVLKRLMKAHNLYQYN